MVESQDGDSLGQVTQLTETIIQFEETPEEDGGEEEEEVDMEGGGHVTPDGPHRTARVSRPLRCGTEGHFHKKHGDTNHEKVVDATRGRGRLPTTVMIITYAFPTLSFPHTMYTYIGVEVVDNNGVNIIFDVADGISGYSPTLYTESSRPHERDPSKQQYLDDDTCFADDMHDDSTILEQHNDYVEHDSAFDNNLGDDDEVSQRSEEDIDEGLEAEDHEEHEIPEFEPPCSMFIDDTWTNIVDPRPQMPTKSHVGWDGHCELFKGQVFFSKEEVQNTVKKYSMQQNNVVKTSASSPTTLAYKCKNPVPC
ncbi:hypothetical protein RHGRI_029758 [Rhododendron griersonianum]|uniref:Uncharacterized protein n=1 Tax=Rhododendron griersonianum TaxID=479676 RepID=A0AAV6IKK7_9ERIC|nr:hypothetical protein RHGRI_029758 [Rhododendron griersonianum]